MSLWVNVFLSECLCDTNLRVNHCISMISCIFVRVFWYLWMWFWVSLCVSSIVCWDDFFVICSVSFSDVWCLFEWFLVSQWFWCVSLSVVGWFLLSFWLTSVVSFGMNSGLFLCEFRMNSGLFLCEVCLCVSFNVSLCEFWCVFVWVLVSPWVLVCLCVWVLVFVWVPVSLCEL